MLWIYQVLSMGLFLLLCCTNILAEDFYLDSPLNKSMLRFEVDNDIVWNKDSNFTNSWNFQYHTLRYASWKETEASEFVKWVGENFPTLDDESSIVRNSYSIGQNMFTPGDLKAEIPQDGDLPYAGTLSYALNWQSINRQTARVFQFTMGVLGQEALAKEFQKFAHENLGHSDNPRGWDTQRDTEPILNVGYQYLWRLAHYGNYTNDWAGQITLGPGVSLGNLSTFVELGVGFRFGWNILEGFSAFPAPSGGGFAQAACLPKPSHASSHGVEVVFGVRGTGLLYSTLYDGSILTSDTRSVEREEFVASGLIGFNYHYYKLFSIRLHFQVSTNILDEGELPKPLTGREETETDYSYGALIVDFYF